MVFKSPARRGGSSEQGNRPYASTTPDCLQTSYLRPVFCSFSFQSLAHSFAGTHSTTPLHSYRSALFAENTGGGYIPRDLFFVFKRLRTLSPACASCPGRDAILTRRFALSGQSFQQTLRNQYIPHSFAQRALPNSFFFKRFRTLPIATRVDTPNLPDLLQGPAPHRR